MLTHLKNSKSLEIEIYRGRRYSCPSLCPGTGGSCSHGKGSPRYLEDIHDWKIFVIYNFYRLFITTFTGQVYAFNKIAGDKVIWPNSHYLHCHCHYNRCHHHDANPDVGVALARAERCSLVTVQRDAMGFRLAKGEGHDDDGDHHDHHHNCHEEDHHISHKIFLRCFLRSIPLTILCLIFKTSSSFLLQASVVIIFNNEVVVNLNVHI